MNLKPELLQALVDLGVTSDEVALLQDRMLSAVTGLQASLNALDAQIAQLQSQRATIVAELSAATVTVSKLGDL